MQELWIFATLSLVSLWLWRRWQERHFLLLTKEVPSITRHMFTGFGFILTSKGTIKTIRDNILKYGKNVLIYIGPFPTVLTSDPVLIKDVLNAKQCINKSYFAYAGLTNAIGNGLITLSDPQWGVERRVLNTAFNNKNLLSFIPIFNAEINDLLRNIDADIESGGRTKLVVFFREFTLHIATQTTIGRALGKTGNNVKEIAANVGISLEYVSSFTFNMLYNSGIMRKLANMIIFREGVKTIKSVKSMIRESLEYSGAKRGKDSSFVTDINTAMDYACTGVQQNKIRPENLIDSLFHIFIGAFETTSTTLYLILILLGMHPEYQQRAYEEVCTIFPDDDDEQFEVTYEKIGEMVYLEMIMNETMRLFPIIPHVARKVMGGALPLSNGIVLPTGTSVYIDLVSLHRSKEFWGPDAEQFNPDNFLPTNVEQRHPYSFLPFTKGVRFCIGWRYGQMSIKAALAKLIKRYKFSTDAKLEDLVIEHHITSQLTKDPPLTIERRKRATNN